MGFFTHEEWSNFKSPHILLFLFVLCVSVFKRSAAEKKKRVAEFSSHKIKERAENKEKNRASFSFSSLLNLVAENLRFPEIER